MGEQAITIQIPGPSALTSARQLATLAKIGSLYLFQGDRDALDTVMEELINRFGMRGPVQVIVGGNRISFERLSLTLGQQIGQIYEVMDRIFISRAETCYQMKDVLAALEPNTKPIVITEMLASFYEDDLTLQEVTLLLQKCLRRIHHLCHFAPVLISASPDPSRPSLIQLIEENSDERFYFQTTDNVETVPQTAFPGF